MIPSPSLPWFELARFRRSRLTRAAVAAVVLVPLLYGALYVWANINPTGRVNHVKAAVVNADQRLEITGPDGTKQTIAVGRELAANLIRDDSNENYDWVLTTPEDAQQGLMDGEYKAVLTLPKNLSKAATSTDGKAEDAFRGQMSLQTNDAVNYVNGQIAPRIVQATKEAMNATVTETYLDNVYISFSDVKSALEDASAGARRLAEGAAELADGSVRAADGANQLAAANRKIADGANQLNGGLQQLAAGTEQLDRATDGLGQKTALLADGSRQVSAGADQVNGIVQGATGQILGAVGTARGQSAQLGTLVSGALIACQTAAGQQPSPLPPNTAPINCRPIQQLANQAGGFGPLLDTITKQANDARTGTQRLADGARQVADGNAELARQAPRLEQGADEINAGAQRAASGSGELANGADRAAQGADQLAAGTGALKDGADQLGAGAGKLAQALADGAGRVPDYNKQQREKLAGTVATPLTDVSDTTNRVDNYGTGLAPYFMSLALWVGAMAIYLLLRPFSDRAAASTSATGRVALAGLLPGAALAVVQTLLLVGVLAWGVGINAANWPGVIGIGLLASVVFTALNQAFVALFGVAGRFLAIVFVCLQLTAAGGTYPIETAPGFFSFLHPLMPMTYSVHGLRATISGSTMGLGQDVFALLVFGVIAFALTVYAVMRRQQITVQRLHPTLTV